MSYRHTIITEFLYGRGVPVVEFISTALHDAGCVAVRVEHTDDGHAAYVSGWFKTLDDDGPRAFAEDLRIPCAAVILTEDGRVFHVNGPETAE